VDTAVGYTGLLLGPPLVGLAADGVGIRTALVLVVVVAGVGALLARRTR